MPGGTSRRCPKTPAGQTGRQRRSCGAASAADMVLGENERLGSGEKIIYENNISYNKYFMGLWIYFLMNDDKGYHQMGLLK